MALPRKLSGFPCVLAILTTGLDVALNELVMVAKAIVVVLLRLSECFNIALLLLVERGEVLLLGVDFDLLKLLLDVLAERFRDVGDRAVLVREFAVCDVRNADLRAALVVYGLDCRAKLALRVGREVGVVRVLLDGVVGVGELRGLSRRVGVRVAHGLSKACLGLKHLVNGILRAA